MNSTSERPAPKEHSALDCPVPACDWAACCCPHHRQGQEAKARWEIVDAHRCTACGHLDTDGYRMVEHLRTQHWEVSGG